MIDFIATVITILILLAPVAAVIALVYFIRKKKAVEVKPKNEPKEEPKEEKKPEPITFTGMIYLTDEEHEDDFFDAYKKDFNTTDDYKLTKAELKENFECDKVYKYYPYKLDYEIVGNDVLAPLKGEMVKIGSLTDEQVEIINKDGGVLSLYQNIYKEVFDTVEIVEDDPFFGFYIRKRNRNL